MMAAFSLVCVRMLATAAVHAPLQRLEFPWLSAFGVELAVLRLDLLDARISGNKWFKLQPHLQLALEQGCSGLMSLGGAHSNHLHALAAAGERLGLATVGLLRGEEQDTPTVADLKAAGMHLHWLGYGGYRQRHQQDFWLAWQALYPNFMCIDEGGYSLASAQACQSIVGLAQQQLAIIGWDDYDTWYVPAGTGTTAAGIIMAEQGRHSVQVAMAVPAGHGVEANLHQILAHAANAPQAYCVHDASVGAFAKLNPELARFILQADSSLRLEPLYTGKALQLLYQHVQAGRWPSGTRVLFVHTGGLQGRRALETQLQHLARS